MLWKIDGQGMGVASPCYRVCSGTGRLFAVGNLVGDKIHDAVKVALTCVRLHGFQLSNELGVPLSKICGRSIDVFVDMTCQSLKKSGSSVSA